MKTHKRIAMLFALLFCLSNFTLYSQDLTLFELVNNSSVGLTAAPFEKWGMAISDIDRNGYPDILCTRWAAPGYSRIYTNSNGVFQDITDQSPLEAVESVEEKTTGVIWVDYDNDGDRDLSMTTNLAIHLFRNDNNVFTEVSEETGFVGYKPPGFITEWTYNMGGWADFDLDGDLDCAITQTNNPKMYLFRNDGGHFTNVSEQAGLDNTEMAQDYRLSWFDFDLDGDPDLHSRANMYRNDGGVFTNVSAEMGFDQVTGVTYREFFDYDNDGDFDFFKVNGYPTSGDVTEVWKNDNGVFVNAIVDLNFYIPLDNYRGLSIGDFDNDGDVDVFVQNGNYNTSDILLANTDMGDGTQTLADVAEFLGITVQGNRKGGTFLDYDRDGFLDIYISSAEHNHLLYHNLGGNDANWIAFTLEGTISNRDAVGTLVTLYTGDKKQVRYTTCGNGFTRQDYLWAHFGIGFETAIDSVVIKWPLGDKQVLTGLEINQYHNIKEPGDNFVDSKDITNTKPDEFCLTQNYPNPFNPVTNFTYKLPASQVVNITVYDISGRKICTLVNDTVSQGDHSVSWTGVDDHGHNVASGVYVYRMTAGDFVKTRKMTLLK